MNRLPDKKKAAASGANTDSGQMKSTISIISDTERTVKPDRELYRCGELRITACDGAFTLWRGEAAIESGKDWRPISAVFFATAEMRAQRRFEKIVSEWEGKMDA